jgi:hypothetical protein
MRLENSVHLQSADGKGFLCVALGTVCATCQAEYLAYSWDATEEWTSRGSDGSFVGRE